MAGARNWLGAIRRRFAKSSCKSIAVIVRTNSMHNVPLEVEVVAAAATKEIACSSKDGRSWKAERLQTMEDFAAIKIQACFRGHLARRAFRALRSLVKLQALVRGVCVRRQARTAIHCMQAMVQLHVRIRARQLLSSSGSGEMELLQPYS